MANRLVVPKHGQIIADTTPNELLDRAAGQVWSLTVDTATALQLQQQVAVSAMVQQPNGVTLRIISPTSPHQNALVVEPNLEEAYLLAVGKEVQTTE
jgi:ABC-2 type transport system ATP-binding protein